MFRLRDQGGFTAIELLTVIVIIGVLAAIAVPAFFHHRDRARDAQAKGNARAAQTAAIEIGEENGGRFDGPGGITLQNLVEHEGTLTDVNLRVPQTSAHGYTLRVRSETGNTFDITQHDNATVDLTCASAADSGCPSDGTWD